ncbi:Palmitoyl-protein_thioesterase [Hexamita inflata]|uniref:Palmitoyl-protein thioesterase n=1 Tax=Hexamita inflata TaxID=28002 RepID=A0AA86PKT0_9EUKA|nr:Palmitoyl-protein thioesterase [Hexamita inflata]
MILQFVIGQYVPTVLVHGLGEQASDYVHIQANILKMYPEMLVLPIEIGNGKVDSYFKSIPEQVSEMAVIISNNPQLARGFNLICHSQGSIICRTYVEQYNQPKVNRMILLAGPNAGYFCGTISKCPGIGNMPRLDKLVDDIIYSDFIQTNIGPSGIWKSPYNFQSYQQGSQTLAVIDNELIVNSTYRANIQALDKLILVGSPDDDQIVPWQSQFFDFWAANSDSKIEKLKDQIIYKQDKIGLRNLDERGDLIMISVNGFNHVAYYKEENQEWMSQNVYQWLNQKGL